MMLTTLDSECEQSQQDSLPLLCTARLCISAWEWYKGHGVHSKGRGQPSRVSLWQPLFEPGFFFLLCVPGYLSHEFAEIFLCRFPSPHESAQSTDAQSTDAHRTSPDTHRAISSASFPLQVLWWAFHCTDIVCTFSLHRHSSCSYIQVTGDDAAFHFGRVALVGHMACRQSLPSCRPPTMQLSVCLSVPMLCRGLRLGSSHLSRFAHLVFLVSSQETTTSTKPRMPSPFIS